MAALKLRTNRLEIAKRIPLFFFKMGSYKHVQVNYSRYCLADRLMYAEDKHSSRFTNTDEGDFSVRWSYASFAVSGLGLDYGRSCWR